MNRLATVDTGLLVLRVWLAIGLFTNHGWEKLAHFGEMAQNFPDPLHIGKTTGLGFALLSDSICSLLVALGLFTRISSLIILTNLSVAFFIFWNAALTQIDGELPFVYLGGYLAVLICGAGRFSVDDLMHRKGFLFKEQINT